MFFSHAWPGLQYGTDTVKVLHNKIYAKQIVFNPISKYKYILNFSIIIIINIDAGLSSPVIGRSHVLTWKIMEHFRYFYFAVFLFNRVIQSPN